MKLYCELNKLGFEVGREEPYTRIYLSIQWNKDIMGVNVLSGNSEWKNREFLLGLSWQRYVGHRPSWRGITVHLFWKSFAWAIIRPKHRDIKWAKKYVNIKGKEIIKGGD